jgi:poly(A) polymerase
MLMNDLDKSNYSSDAIVYGKDECGKFDGLISRAALNVIEGLNKAGYNGYLVGGAVRDILIGKPPKDFDIATDARPEQVIQIFKNSRIIGRRFRIVHVSFGREIIEVATFRAPHGQSSNSAKTSADGQILRDNVYGRFEDDVWRRDFTINALYYDIRISSVIDYVGGMRDLRSKIIRLIGDPEVRYREDPVRMLRAIRFAAKLDFEIIDSTGAPISALGGLLQEISPARLFDESLKLFSAGDAYGSYKGLIEHDLFRYLYSPQRVELSSLDVVDDKLILRALKNTDNRIKNGKSVNPAFLIAVFLWGTMQQHFKAFHQDGLPDRIALQKALELTISKQIQQLSIPKRFTMAVKEIWELQIRFFKRTPKRAYRLYCHPRFRAAYDFFILRSIDEVDLKEIGHWWTVYQELDEQQRQKLFDKIDNHTWR